MVALSRLRTQKNTRINHHRRCRDSIFREKMASNSEKEMLRAFDFCRADPSRSHDRFSCFKSEKGAFMVSVVMLRICEAGPSSLPRSYNVTPPTSLGYL
jgi:hypothetical protein